MRCLTVVLALFSVVAVQSSASAMIVENVTQGTTVFADDFEGVSPVSTVPAYDGSARYSPTAVTGTWVHSEGLPAVPGLIQVTNSTTSPDPGAYQGSNYLRMYRDGNTAGHDGNELQALPAGGDLTTFGDVIRARMMVYLPSATDQNARLQMALIGTAVPQEPGGIDIVGTGRAWIRPGGDGNVYYVAPGVSVQPTGLHYSTNTWQEWDIEYQIGASTFSASVGGVTVSGLSALTQGGVGAFWAVNGSNVAGSWYMDSVASVPEPSTIVMLACGMMGLLAYAWRKRK
jgi:hypothetical protein